jgi:hypothetical protein
MKRASFILVISTILLTACASQPTAVPSPTSTATVTPQPTLTPTSIPPTPAFHFVDLENGGFSLLVHPQLEFDIDDRSINLSDTQGYFVVSLNGRTYIASEYTMESFLGKYLDEMASRGGTFIQSVPYEIEIDGMSGTAVNISGFFLNAPIAGKAFVISPGENFIVFGLGMSNLAANKNEWAETGSDTFEALLTSIKFKEDVKK